MIDLPRVLSAAAEVQSFCNQHAWPFCFIGGIAVQRWGEPRMTQDVDLTLLTGIGPEERFTDTLLRFFSGRRPDSREFALKYRVLLIRTADGVDLDVAFGALPFEERSISRASGWPCTPSHSLTTCSAEDLIVHKAFASRDLDWSDVERVLIRQHGRLDLEQIRTELKPLLDLKGDTESLKKLEQKIAIVERRLRGRL